MTGGATRRVRVSVASLVLATGGVLVGCGSDDVVTERSEGRDAERLNAAVAAVIDGSDVDHRFAVREVTKFAWDKVCAYTEGASKEEIERNAGGRVELNDILYGSGSYYYGEGTLLVFSHKGRPVKALDIIGYELGSLDKPESSCDSGDAEIVANSYAPGQNSAGHLVLISPQR